MGKMVFPNRLLPYLLSSLLLLGFTTTAVVSAIECPSGLTPTTIGIKDATNKKKYGKALYRKIGGTDRVRYYVYSSSELTGDFPKDKDDIVALVKSRRLKVTYDTNGNAALGVIVRLDQEEYKKMKEARKAAKAAAKAARAREREAKIAAKKEEIRKKKELNKQLKAERQQKKAEEQAAKKAAQEKRRQA